MSPISKFALLALVATSALAAPMSPYARVARPKRAIGKRDVVTELAFVTDVVYATVVVDGNGAASTPAPAAVTASVLGADFFHHSYHHHHHSHSTAARASYTPPAASIVPTLTSSTTVFITSTLSSSSEAFTPAPVASSVEEVGLGAVVTSLPFVLPSVVDKSSSTSSSKPTPVVVSSSSIPTSSALPIATSAPVSSSGKRGLAYNTAALADLFSAFTSQVSWAYNWGSTSSGLISTFEYVPMLWSVTSSFTSGWDAAVTTALATGSTHLMSFNEPDLPAQANLSPAAAAQGYKTYMQPYAGKAKLGAPAVTNGGGAMGLAWLGEFLTACSSCTIDFVSIHWYDSATNIDYFKQHITDAHTQTGKPVWLTEFGASGSDDQVNSFLEEVLPWLDAQDFVERYAYFMVDSGHLLSGNALSSYGHTYATLAN